MRKKEKLIIFAKAANILLKLLKLQNTMITIHSKESLNKLFKETNYQTIDLWKKQRKTFKTCPMCKQAVSCKNTDKLPGIVTIHHKDHQQKHIRDLCIRACLSNKVLNTWEHVITKIKDYHINNKAVALACTDCCKLYNAGKLPELESHFKTLPEWLELTTKKK